MHRINSPANLAAWVFPEIDPPPSESELFKISLKRKEKDNKLCETCREYKVLNISARFKDYNALMKTSSKWILEENFSSVAGIKNDYWYIKVNDWYISDSYQYQIFVYCDTISVRDVHIRAIWEVYIIDNEGNKTLIGYHPNIYYGMHHNEIGRFCVETSGEEKEKFLPDDTLTLKVKLTILDNTTLLPGFPLIELYPKNYLPDYYEELYINRLNNGDSMIQVQQQLIIVHKEVIEMRCPKLSVKLIPKGTQRNYNDFNVLDIDYHVFEKLLEFIYLDKISDIDNCIVPLLMIAYKLDLPELQRKGEKELAEEFLTMENAPIMYSLAKYLRSYKLLPYIRHFWELNNTGSNIVSFCPEESSSEK